MDKITRKDFYVYALFRDDGSIFYIGKGQGKRWRQHAIDAVGGKRGRRFDIIRDIRKRSAEMPMLKIHEGLTSGVALIYERALIAAIGRHPHGPLLNRTSGGQGTSGYIHSPETREKLAAALRGKKQSPELIEKRIGPTRGLRRSAEWRANIAAALKGIKPSSQCEAARLVAITGKPLSAAHKAKVGDVSRGVPRSPETKEKTSATLRGHVVSDATRTKISVTLRMANARRRAEAKKAAD